LHSHGFRRYPGVFESGHKISGIENVTSLNDVQVFQAGTKLAGSDLVTSGGRVLGVTARGVDLETSIRKAYRALEKIHFDGMQYRKDIGVKGLRRYNAGMGT